MKNISIMNRRRFLQSGALVSAALAAAIPTSTLAAVTKAPGDPFHGLKLGIASYSLRNFPLDKALAMTQQLGIKYITLKDMHLPFKTTTAERQEARRKVQAAGLVLMVGGVIYINNKEDEVRAQFEYVKDAGMPVMVCSPDPAALDRVEKYAREYNIRIAIHNHGPGDKRYPSPLDVLELVKNRDPLMGLCIDVGHTVRLGLDPVEVTKKCADRLYDFHIKDVTEAAPKGGGIEVGQGVIDIPAVLKSLIDIKFKYHVALEYEANGDAPMPGLIGSFAFMRGVLAVI